MLLELYALPTVGAQMDWERFNAFEHDVLTLWMAYPQLEPKKLLKLLRPHLGEGGLYSFGARVFSGDGTTSGDASADVLGSGCVEVAV